MQLSELNNGEKAVIVKVKGHSGFRRRIGEMGFIKGKEVSVIRNAPLKDPVEYEIMGYDVSLRRQEADMIEVITLQEAKSLDIFENLGSFNDTEILKKTAKIKSHHIKIAFVGNPNAGKTTLFNNLSGAKEKVGNYGGVTVDVKKASVHINNYDIDLYDLPGTYSLSVYSHEELFVRNFIFNNSPDLVVNVIDSSNLERNLYLTTQLIDMNIPIVIALNMYDELEKKKANLDHDQLGKILGIPVVTTVGSKAKGLNLLINKIIDVYEGNDPTSRLIHINYGFEIEKSIEKVKENIKGNKHLTTIRSGRYLALKLLEKDKHVQDIIKNAENAEEILATADIENKRLETEYNDKIEVLFTDVKYGFISGALKETYNEPLKRISNTENIDSFLIHKLFGFPIFFLFMFLMFFLTFNVGQFPMEWIDKLFGLLSDIVVKIMPDGSFRDLLTEGIISGLGSVLVFLPNILILFFFISFMEDTGYMARAAFIMDKLMHKIGLHGKSFIPLLMGFGCNVPAILSTRILENRQDRLLTILINPFMSCSARLPVYILIIGAFFPAFPTLMLMGIYIFGIVLAIVSALVMKKVLFKQKSTPFVMELPPYRVPTFKVIMRHMWDKGVEYIKKVGGTILIAVIIIWALKYFPQNDKLQTEKTKKIASIEQTISNKKIKTIKIDSINKLFKYKHLEQSYLRKLGNYIEPIVKPIGLDWKTGISITTGIAAKEIVVSTLGVIYQADDGNNNSLQNKIRESSLNSNKNEPEANLKALSFLIFILIYFPCIGVVAAVKKETGGWKWPIFMIIYTTSLAWLLSFLIYQIGSLFI